MYLLCKVWGHMFPPSFSLLHFTQHIALLKIAMTAGEDAGIEVTCRGATLFAAGSLGDVLRPRCVQGEARGRG
jgi:hypothetical protein